MPDSYHLPALVLTVLLLPAFCPTLPALSKISVPCSGFSASCLPSSACCSSTTWAGGDVLRHHQASLDRRSRGQTSILISSALFLASLVPQRFPYRAILHSLRRPLHHSARRLRDSCSTACTAAHLPMAGRFSSSRARGPFSSCRLLLGLSTGPACPGQVRLALCIVLGGTSLCGYAFGPAEPIGRLVFVECATSCHHCAARLLCLSPLLTRHRSRRPRLRCLVCRISVSLSPSSTSIAIGISAHPHHRHGQGCCRRGHDPDRTRRAARRSTRPPRIANSHAREELEAYTRFTLSAAASRTSTTSRL